MAKRGGFQGGMSRKRNANKGRRSSKCDK